MNSHLTLNFGLRWELLPAFKETQGDIASFDPRLNSIVVPDRFSALAGSSPLLTSVYNAVLESYNGCSLGNKLASLPCTPVIWPARRACHKVYGILRCTILTHA